MVIELAMAGMLQCTIAHKQIVEDDINCFYQCVDTTKEFASTLKEYQCPRVLYAVSYTHLTLPTMDHV